MKKNNSKKAFSLIEVLVFITILALFFVTAAAVVTASLRNMKINEHKILASHYAEELLEWFRGEKEADWHTFAFTSINGSLEEHPNDCFNFNYEVGEQISWTTRGCDLSLGGMFNRRAWFEPTDVTRDQIDVYIEVAWEELGNSYSIPLRSRFSIWE